MPDPVHAPWREDGGPWMTPDPPGPRKRPGMRAWLAVAVLAAAALAGAAFAVVPALATPPSAVSHGPVTSVRGGHLRLVPSNIPNCDWITPDVFGTYVYYWDDPGLGNVVKIIGVNKTCYKYVADNGFFQLRVNGGSDCAKVIHPDANADQNVVDEGCDDTPGSLWFFQPNSDGSNWVGNEAIYNATQGIEEYVGVLGEGGTDGAVVTGQYPWKWVFCTAGC